MAIFEYDDCELFYECIGEGKECLILLHGNGEDHTYFHNQIACFKNTYQILVVDMRGHGASSMGNKNLDFALFAQDVLALMDQLKIEKAHVLGFSDGGNTAITMALHAQERMLSLILNGADLDPKEVKRHVQIPIILGYRLLCLFHSPVAKAKQQVMGLMVNHPHIDIKLLENVHIPTLVLVGNKDMIKEDHSKRIAQHIPNAEFCVLKGSHFIAQTQPQQYNEVVSTFLNAHHKE